jgi:mRNA-degrading endonuclease YafQ of YafQ-DinJ toxin-antitoxin module
MKQKIKIKKNFKKSFAKALRQGQTLISLWAYVSHSLNY